MEAQGFDQLVRAASGGSSRRRLLRLLASGVVGGLLLRSGRSESEARVCRLAGERCSDRHPCCGRNAVCRDHVCVCRRGFTDACGDGYCRNLDNDERACGSCETVCAAGETCCGGNCVDLNRNDKHCGGCGIACKTGQTCCGGRCRDLRTDERHCGACGRVCDGGGSCVDGTCIGRTCRHGDDFCGAPATAGCGVGCGCVRVLDSEVRSRCAQSAPIACEHCFTHDECVRRYGQGAFCGASSGPGCYCQELFACFLPCER